MPKMGSNRLLRAESLTAIGIVLVCAGLLIPTLEMRPISALLPGVMLISLILLALWMFISDQRSASQNKAPKVMTKSPKRVLGAFVLVLLYALSVDFIGFYVSTAISVPLVAYLFGFKSPAGLAVATIIVLSVIYLIFGFAISQEFPTGRLWS